MSKSGLVITNSEFLFFHICLKCALSRGQENLSALIKGLRTETII